MEGGVTTNPQTALAELLAPEMDRVNTLIRTRTEAEHAARIGDVASHLVNAGGKRLRCMLTLSAAKLYGYEGSGNVLLATAVELIHTATLLHDDVVDESRQRRGTPTANLLWDNKSSVLVGDFLFARSFQLMVETGSQRVLGILSNAAATIAEAEVLQLVAAQNLATDENRCLRIARGKTAALFSAATESGSVIADAPEEHIIAFREYGDALGIAFQISDDLLDYLGDTAVTGKGVGEDFRAGKPTLPVIKAVAEASEKEREFWQRVIERRERRDGDFERAMALMEKYDTLSRTRDDAFFWSARARNALGRLPSHPVRDVLEDLADHMVARLA